MAQSVCTHAYKIVELDKMKNSRHKRNRIIDEGGMDLVRCICDCVKNVLRGNVPVTDEEKERLRRYKDSLRDVGQEKDVRQEEETFNSGRWFSRSTHPCTCGISR